MKLRDQVYMIHDLFLMYIYTFCGGFYDVFDVRQIKIMLVNHPKL